MPESLRIEPLTRLRGSVRPPTRCALPPEGRFREPGSENPGVNNSHCGKRQGLAIREKGEGARNQAIGGKSENHQDGDRRKDRKLRARCKTPQPLPARTYGPMTQIPGDPPISPKTGNTGPPNVSRKKIPPPSHHSDQTDRSKLPIQKVSPDTNTPTGTNSGIRTHQADDAAIRQKTISRIQNMTSTKTTATNSRASGEAAKPSAPTRALGAKPATPAKPQQGAE